MKIINRVLFFPFMACIMLINYIGLYLQALYFYIRYGGESVIYRPEDRASMVAIFRALEATLKELDTQRDN